MVEIALALVQLSRVGSAAAMVVVIRPGATLPWELDDASSRELQDHRVDRVEQGMPGPLGSAELWHNAARCVVEAADNLRTAVGLRSLLLGSDVSEVQCAAGIRNIEEPAVCFLQELADGHAVRMQPEDDFNVLADADGEVLENPVASEITLQTFSGCTNEVNKHLVTSESIPQTPPVSADEDQQHPEASKSIPQTSPVSRGQLEAVSVVEDVQVLEVGSAQHASKENQASNSQPVACPDPASDSRGETGAVATMDTTREEPKLGQGQQQLEQAPAITASPGRVGREMFPMRSTVPRQPRSQSTKGSCLVTTLRQPKRVADVRAVRPRSIPRRSISSSNPRNEMPGSEKLDLTITAFSLPRGPMSNGGKRSTNITSCQSNGSVATQPPRRQNSRSSPSHEARPQSARGPSRHVVAAVPEPSTSCSKDSSMLESLAQAGDKLFSHAQEAAWTSSQTKAVASRVGRPCHMPSKLRDSHDHADILRDIERRSFALHQAAHSLQRSREKCLKGVSRQSEALRYMKDELAIDGNEEVLFKPLACHSRLLQQASDEHSRQREALCDMVGAECRSRESLQRELHHIFGRVKTAFAELNAAIEAAFEELAKDDRIMPKAAAWNLQILQYAVEDEADGEMASTISTTRSSTALSSSSSTAATDGFPSHPCSAISSTGSMTGNTWATSSALGGVTFH